MLTEIKVYVGNKDAYDRNQQIGKWIKLPLSDEKLKENIKEILGQDTQYIIYNWGCEQYKFNESCDIYKVNDMVKFLVEFKRYELLEFKAILECVDSFNEARDIFTLENFIYLDGVSNFKELGEYVVHESVTKFNLPEEIERCFNHENVGTHYYKRDKYRFVETGAIRIIR